MYLCSEKCTVLICSQHHNGLYSVFEADIGSVKIPSDVVYVLAQTETPTALNVSRA